MYNWNIIRFGLLPLKVGSFYCFNDASETISLLQRYFFGSVS